jgi:hypothetical protein
LNSLHSQQKLECRSGKRLYSYKDKTYANFHFFEWTNTSFQQVLEHAKTIEKEIHQSKLVASAIVLMALLPDDVYGFCRQLVHAHLGDKHSLSGLYADEPILASADSTRFVQSLMTLSPMSRRDLLYGIAQRYKHPEIARMLFSELQWLEMVDDGLKRELSCVGTSIEAFQLKSAMDEYITPSIENLRAARKSQEAPQESTEVAEA